MTDFYSHGSWPATGSAGTSSPARAEFDAIAAGFALLAPYTGNANKIVVVNSGGTGYTVTTGTLALAGNFATTGAYNLTIAQTGSVTMTLPATSFTVARTDAANTFTGTQTIGALVATTVNGHTFTTGSSTFTGTAGQTYTFPTTTATIARTDAANTFTGTQTIGALVATTVNGNTFTTGTGVLTIAASKTLTVSNTITLAGTDGTTMTFPATSASIARTDAANTFTGVQTMTSPATTTSITTGSASFTAWAGATTLLTIGGTGASASLFAPSTLDATTSTTGAIRTSGGISAAKALRVGGLANIAGTVTAQTGIVISASGLTVNGGAITSSLGTVDATSYTSATLSSGGTSGASVGGIIRQRTSGVSNAASVAILTHAGYGALTTVTGVGSGRIFHDLVLADYNAVTVVASATALGSPASRTYSVANNGTLKLQMGDATAMAIIAQCLMTGGYGA